MQRWIYPLAIALVLSSLLVAPSQVRAANDDSFGLGVIVVIFVLMMIGARGI